MRKNTIWYILAIALVLRVVGINQSFWLDEATSATVARDLSYQQIITEFSPGDFHPPLYYIVLKAWGSVFGYGDISLRLPSVIFALGTIYIVYLIGKHIKKDTVGILSALFLATAPLHIYYSQEARMYSMVTFFVTLCIYSFMKFTQKNQKKYLIIYSMSILAVFLTDYLPLLILPAVIFARYLAKKKGKLWPEFIVAHIPLLVGFVSLLPILANQLSVGLNVENSLPGWWNILGKTNLKNVLLLPTKILIGRISFENKFIYGIVIIAIFSLFFAIISKSRKLKPNYKVLWLWLIVPPLLGIILGFVVPVFSYFRFLFIVPVIYILLANGLFSLGEKLFVPALAAILLVNLGASLTYLTDYSNHREDWKSMVNHIKNDFSDSTVLVFPANSQMEAVKYYWPEVQILAGPEQISDNKDKIWLVRYIWEIADPQDQARVGIEEAGFTKKEEKDFRGVVVWKYEK